MNGRKSSLTVGVVGAQRGCFERIEVDRRDLKLARSDRNQTDELPHTVHSCLSNRFIGRGAHENHSTCGRSVAGNRSDPPLAGIGERLAFSVEQVIAQGVSAQPSLVFDGTKRGADRIAIGWLK